MIYINI